MSVGLKELLERSSITRILEELEEQGVEVQWDGGWAVLHPVRAGLYFFNCEAAYSFEAGCRLENVPERWLVSRRSQGLPFEMKELVEFEKDAADYPVNDVLKYLFTKEEADAVENTLSCDNGPGLTRVKIDIPMVYRTFRTWQEELDTILKDWKAGEPLSAGDFELTPYYDVNTARKAEMEDFVFFVEQVCLEAGLKINNILNEDCLYRGVQALLQAGVKASVEFPKGYSWRNDHKDDIPF